MSTSAIDDSKYATAGSLTGGATGGSAMDKNAFLMLLVTQFQYQDPLNPMEDKEFVSQLAQFTSLEQSMAMNESLEKLYTLQAETQALQAVNYIGKEVLARGYGLSVQGKTITSVEYALGEGAVSGYVSIMDANGQEVANVALTALGSGIHSFDWTGYMSNGAKAPDGVYTIAISCTAADGTPVIADTQVGGVVKGVSTYNGEQYLTLSDDRVVSVANVREVRTPTAKTPGDTTNPEGTGTGTGTGTGGTGTGTEGTGGTGTGTGGTGTGTGGSGTGTGGSGTGG